METLKKSFAGALECVEEREKFLQILKVSEEITSKKLQCYRIKERVDDYSLEIFESCITFEKLLVELDAKYKHDREEVSHRFGSVIHPLISKLSDLSIVYQDLHMIYSDLLVLFSKESATVETPNPCLVYSSTCIRSLVESASPYLELDDFKKSVEKIYRDLYTISQTSLNKVKNWISTIIHHLDSLELNYQFLISDLVDL
jgi:hypothetical protein